MTKTEIVNLVISRGGWHMLSTAERVEFQKDYAALDAQEKRVDQWIDRLARNVGNLAAVTPR